MQLAGPGVFGPPKDRDAAVAVLREAVDLGINHIDTSDYYGPHVTNEIIREALAPYPEDLHIVTKVGGRRDDEGNWLRASSPDELRRAVHDNLGRLGLEAWTSSTCGTCPTTTRAGRRPRGPSRSRRWPPSSRRDWSATSA